MDTLRLRKIVRFLDFRKSEMTNYEEFARKRANKELIEALGAKDCVMFTNTTEDQIVFVSGFRQVTDVGGRVTAERQILCSRRLRLKNGRWSPALLVEYAETVGLKLEGLNGYREQYEKRRAVPPRAERDVGSTAGRTERTGRTQHPASAVLHHH